MKRAISIACLAGLSTTIGSAQQPALSGARRAAVELVAQAGGWARVALETRVTRGAPYAGEAVTEFVQLLPDGNRIVRRTTTRLYRDSDGRTRREQVSDASGRSEPNSVVITDPVAGVSLILDSETRTGQRAPATVATFSGGTIAMAGTGAVTVSRAPGSAQVEVAARGSIERRGAETPEAIALAEKIGDLPTAVNVVREQGERGQESKEDLGQQMIEGMMATGTRTTTTIPAGAIGNEQPLTIVSEQWFSPELKVLVLTKHSDPRVGETTYRLTNIQRAEPDRSLFQVPADYAVKDPRERRRP